MASLPLLCLFMFTVCWAPVFTSKPENALNLSGQVLCFASRGWHLASLVSMALTEWLGSSLFTIPLRFFCCCCSPSYKFFQTPYFYSTLEMAGHISSAEFPLTSVHGTHCTDVVCKCLVLFHWLGGTCSRCSYRAKVSSHRAPQTRVLVLRQV